MIFPILGVYPKEGNQWKFGIETISEFLDRNDLYEKNGKVYFKIRETDEESKMEPFWSFISKDIGTGETAKAELKRILGEHGFETVKPTDLIKKLVFHSSIENANDIILDFFSGSATTAHAVMQLNAEDGGNRKFICVQIPEPCAEDSEAFKAGYKNICEIGKERIRRAGKKIADNAQCNINNAQCNNAQCAIKDAKQEDVSIDGNGALSPLDIGFKVFKVADTNIRMFSNELNNVDLLRQIDIRDIDPEQMDFNNGATDLDVCYELLLRHRGIPLSSKVDKLSIGERTYIIADSIVVCLEQTITQSLVEQLAAIDPLPNKYIFRDSSFGDDISLKENTMIYLQAIIEKNSGTSKKAYTVEFI